MNRAAEQPPRDHQPQRRRDVSIPPLTTRAATSSPRNEPSRSEHTSAAAGSRRKPPVKTAKNTATKRAPGKQQRKRSRAEMTTSSLRDSMDVRDALALKASPSKRSRPSLSETHSDEDDDAARFSAPPPPPTHPVPPELLCRYPNKPCPQERATKKHGELHSYCAYHRFKAQQYQRKLEQKKRERRLREESSPSALLAATTLAGGSGAGGEPIVLRGLALEPGAALYPHHSPLRKTLSPPARRTGARARTRSSPPRPSGAWTAGSRNSESSRVQSGRIAGPSSRTNATAAAATTLEPFHHPVSLQEGDLQLLQVFLWDSESPPKPDASGPGSQSRTAHADSRANPATTMTRNRPDGSDAYNVSLDGFTFTSESL